MITISHVPSEIDGKTHLEEHRLANHRDWNRVGRSYTTPARRYTDELLRLKCAPDLLALGIFPDSKEVAESFSAYHAVQHHLQRFSMQDPGVTLVAVGDGCVPRTAATFAFRTAWTCHSIDPRMRPFRASVARVDRLHGYAKRAEEVRLEAADRAVIVAVHSHASFWAALDTVPDAHEVAMVVIPCCEPHALAPGGFDHAYDDDGIPSPDRTVYVYGPERIAALRAWRTRQH